MITFFLFGILLLLIPLILLVRFLWIHHKENGEISQLRKIIGILAFVKMLYFVNVTIILSIFLYRGIHLANWILLEGALGTWVIAGANWWALWKIKKLPYEKRV